MKQMNLKIAAGLCGLTFFIAPVTAEEAGKFYVNPALGYQFFDSNRGLDDTETLSIGGEYVLTPKFGVEASYLRSNPDIDVGSGDVDLDQYTLDALYYLKSYNNWQPFLNTGIGHGKFDANGGDADETQVNLGLGSRYSFDSNWSARLQAKLVNSLDEEDWDSIITAGISYAFGGESKPAPKPAPVLLDSDGDGVLDRDDLCKGTAQGVSVDSTGCGLDSDGDGILDANDLCMETPPDIAVNSTGCALDSDDDGIFDYLDDCPNSTVGASVDNNGCEIVIPKTETIKLAINFANNSAVVPTSAMPEIKAVADFMLRNTATTVTIEGHTDNRGNEEYNRKLSQSRADAVMQILINNYDVAASRVSAMGYGQANPIATNDTAAGRQANRRVVAEITHTGVK